MDLLTKLSNEPRSFQWAVSVAAAIAIINLCAFVWYSGILAVVFYFVMAIGWIAETAMQVNAAELSHTGLVVFICGFIWHVNFYLRE